MYDITVNSPTTKAVRGIAKCFRSPEFIEQITTAIPKLFFSPDGIVLSTPMTDVCSIKVSEASLQERQAHCVYRVIPDSSVKYTMVNDFHEKYYCMPEYLKGMIEEMLPNVPQTKVEVTMILPLDVVELNVLYHILSNHWNGIVDVHNAFQVTPNYVAHSKIRVDNSEDYFLKVFERNGQNTTNYIEDKKCLITQIY